jgi:hypothetical protein
MPPIIPLAALRHPFVIDRARSCFSASRTPSRATRRPAFITHLRGGWAAIA